MAAQERFEEGQTPAAPQGTAEPVDAFILFHEPEDSVAFIVDALEGRGISTHFWRRDVQPGKPWEDLERERLRSARSVVLVLGSAGWGPTHRSLAEQALSLKKTVIPVLIGSPSDQALDDVGGIFRKLRYLDLRKPDSAVLDELARTIRGAQQTGREQDGRVEQIIRILVDGNDDQRFENLVQLRGSSGVDRQALGQKLRDQIRVRFSPASEKSIESAARDQNRIASIRSWMVSYLIWSDLENPESVGVLLQCVDERAEPDRHTRFWALGGLYEAKASFLGKAVEQARADTSPEISALARAISSTGPDVVAEYRRVLATTSFTDVWPILRVLRVVPIPELAGDVSARIASAPSGSPLRYDSFYALAHPDMARAAAPFLTKNPGAEQVVASMVADLRESSANAIRAFASLLAAFDAEAIDRALDEARKDPVAQEHVDDLRLYLRRYRLADGGLELSRPGFQAETIDVGRDRLGVREDVETLTAVMLAKDVTPPLAIGLFGDWGTGKSFFMKSMRAASDRFRKADPQGKNFCREVVPIEFNAWHYVDTNLWASLVSHILERLDAYVTPQTTPEQEQAQLEKQLGEAQGIVAETKAQKQRADEVMSQRQGDLEKLKKQRQEKEIELADLRADDIKTLVGKDPTIEKDIKESLDQLGVPKTLKTFSELSQAATEAHTVAGRAAALVTAIVTGKNRRLLFVLMPVVLFGIPALVAILEHRHAIDNVVAKVGAVLTQLVALAASVTAILRRAVSTVKTNLSRLDEARQKVEKLIADKRSKPDPDEIKLEEEIIGLKRKEDEVSARLSSAAARVAELEERIKVLSEGRSLARFLAERTRSEDYRKHLGLISTIRQDLDALSARLAVSASAGMRRVDRIVLYIDDLDRCPADKVMDILQAVHLLLAYPLFVVVVGVDPRWLVRSLRARYSAFKEDNDVTSVGEDLWITTPQNYLEKIFQVTFSLRPMGREGYGSLVGDLLSPTLAQPDGKRLNGTPSKAGGSGTAPVPDPQSKIPTKDAAASASASETPRPTADGRVEAAPIDPSAGAPKPDTRADSSNGGQDQSASEDAVVIHEDALGIRAWESDFAKALFRFVPTPRATKRFANMYRILKAPIRRERLDAFEGTRELPGSFQVPMLLLAVLIRSPQGVARLFAGLQKHAESELDPTEALRDLSLLKLDLDDRELQADLKPIVSQSSFPRGHEIYRHWLPRVARFSFEAGRAVLPADAT
jgi:hypothetical protein